MATYTVTSSTGLAGALKTAHAGDTILLAAGNYAAISISNYHAAGTITISSASSANPAVVASLNVNNSSGLKFSNITFATTLYNAPTSTSAAYPFKITNSSNISFDHINAHGTIDANADNDVNGFYLNANSNISITNSTFQQFYNAIIETNNTNVTISNNTIHDIRSDGIDNSGSSNVSITGNQFSNFFPVGDPTSGGDHPDAIQFWTTNTTSPTNNIVVENNSYTRGTGLAAQGIFITDQIGQIYNNVTVTGNNIIGSMGNGIDITSANNVIVSNNSVIGYNDVASNIRIQNVTNISMNNNIASGYYITSTTFLSQLANQQSGVIAALTTALNLSAPVTTVAQKATVNEYSSLTGNAMTGDHGANIYLADIGVGTGYQKVLTSGGMTLTGSYGTLTIQSNGAYSYVETKDGLTVGQAYDDHFTLTVANQSGSVQTSTLDILVNVSGTGTAAANTIYGGIGAETITGLGGADHLYSGSGPDTFAYTSLADSPAAAHDTIIGFKAGDVIDLSKVDPNFRVVSKFDHHAHELIIVNDGNGAWDLYGDTTGSGSANFQIHLTGATTSLSAGNIVL